MTRIATIAVLLLLAIAGCANQSGPVPPNRTDQGGFIGAPGSGAP